MILLTFDQYLSAEEHVPTEPPEHHQEQPVGDEHLGQHFDCKEDFYYFEQTVAKELAMAVGATLWKKNKIVIYSETINYK